MSISKYIFNFKDKNKIKDKIIIIILIEKNSGRIVLSFISVEELQPEPGGASKAVCGSTHVWFCVWPAL